MKKFEYETLHEQRVGLIQKLEKLGLDGWEAFSIIEHKYGEPELPYYSAFLKREVEK